MPSLLYKKPHHTGKLRDTVFKEVQRKTQNRYYEQNKEQCLEYHHKYYQTNKAKYQEYAKTQYLKKTENINLNYRKNTTKNTKTSLQSIREYIVKRKRR